VGVTAVVMRWSVNIESGARTRFSIVLHGAIIFGVVLFAPALVRAIPAAGAAAILVYVGWRLIDLPGAAALQKQGTAAVLSWFAAAAITVTSDPWWGIVPRTP